MGGREWLRLHYRLAVSQELLNGCWINVCQERSLPRITALFRMPADSFRDFRLTFICLISFIAPAATLIHLAPSLCQQKDVTTYSLPAGTEVKVCHRRGMSLPLTSSRTSRGASHRLPAPRKLSSPANSWLLKYEPPPHPLPILIPVLIPAHQTGFFLPCYLVFLYWPGQWQSLQTTWRKQMDSLNSHLRCCLRRPIPAHTGGKYGS